MTVTDRIRLNTPADVLLIDDNPGDVRLTREAFDESHIATTLHVVNDGAEALAFLNKSGEHEDAPRPDLVLLDLDLPRSGDEFLEAMNETSPRLARVPVVALTSSQAEADIVASYESRADAYTTKPVDPSELVATVQPSGNSRSEVVRLPPIGGGHE